MEFKELMENLRILKELSVEAITGPRGLDVNLRQTSPPDENYLD